jgi:hypothetical protein
VTPDFMVFSNCKFHSTSLLDICSTWMHQPQFHLSPTIILRLIYSNQQMTRANPSCLPDLAQCFMSSLLFSIGFCGLLWASSINTAQISPAFPGVVTDWLLTQPLLFRPSKVQKGCLRLLSLLAQLLYILQPIT